MDTGTAFVRPVHCGTGSECASEGGKELKSEWCTERLGEGQSFALKKETDLLEGRSLAGVGVAALLEQVKDIVGAVRRSGQAWKVLAIVHVSIDRRDEIVV